MYWGDDLDRLFDVLPFNLIQVPGNIYDQRILEGCIPWCEAHGVEIHVRSIFLQGLIGIEPQNLPAHFEKLRTHQAAAHAYLAERGLTPIQGCLRFAFSIDGVHKLVIGVDSAAQLNQLLDVLEAPYPETDRIDWARLACREINLLDPSLWPKR